MEKRWGDRNGRRKGKKKWERKKVGGEKKERGKRGIKKRGEGVKKREGGGWVIWACLPAARQNEDLWDDFVYVG